MFQVEISPQAVKDLLEIKSYIENEFKNPIATHNTVEKIIKTYEDLAKYPEIGIPIERYVSFPSDYKFVLANNYSIFYRIEGKFVKVIRIMYSRRDFIRILFSENDKLS